MDDISTKDELSEISDVLGNLAHYNLEGLVCTPLTHATSTGGSSDTYTSTFKEKVLQDALVSSSCLVCRGSKELRSSETICKRCKYIWGGKLGIKQFRKRIKDRDQWKTIARDLHSLSSLSHPNLLPFVGYFLMEGFPALVTPWIEGGNLRDRIKRGTISRSEGVTVSIARGIVDGLSYLHSKSIVHCDLKSANVFLSSSDSPLLADFSLSRFMESDETILYTHADDGLGGPRWAAPELFECSQFTAQTDVWAFGMILYELLVHKLPFFQQKNSMQVMRHIILGHLPEWPAEEEETKLAESSARSALRDLCEKCWSSTPSDRPGLQEIDEKLTSIVDALSSSELKEGSDEK